MKRYCMLSSSRRENERVYGLVPFYWTAGRMQSHLRIACLPFSRDAQRSAGGRERALRCASRLNDGAAIGPYANRDLRLNSPSPVVREVAMSTMLAPQPASTSPMPTLAAPAKVVKTWLVGPWFDLLFLANLAWPVVVTLYFL